jgi:N-acetyl-anhydromuramyl-L-alanine amidase AmpD
MPAKSFLVLLIAVSLQGCSLTPFRLPWSQSRQDAEGLIAMQERFDAGLDQKNTKSLQSAAQTPAAQPPRLVEPEPSGLRTLNQLDLAQCRSVLALPLERQVPADPTNFGPRFTRDAWGREIASTPMIIVLHETVVSAKETLAFFQTPHVRDEDQASYHLLIDRDGARIRITPDSNRAFGAGMSAFGDVTQRVRPGAVGSINNIALHVSLVSPDDGRDDTDAHSGYTDQQYAALASQILLWQAEYGIPLTRVTTHSAIDRSGSRYDPRSFRWDRFDSYYQNSARKCGIERFDNKQAGL